MSVVHVNSISGITSITTPSSSDVLTLHSSNTTERFRIHTGGQVSIGSATEGHADADDLTIASSGRTGMTIRSGSSEYGNIFFSDATSGSGEHQGIFQYYHQDDAFIWKSGASATERLRIDSSGNITQGIAGSATFSAINSISANAARGIEIHKDGTDTGSAIKLAGDNGSGTKAWSQLGFSGANATAHWANYNTSGTKVGEIVIGSTGNIGIGTDNPNRFLHVQDDTNTLLALDSTDSNADLVQSDTGGSTRIRSVSGALEFFAGGDASSTNATGSGKKLRIGSSGQIGLGGANYGTTGQVLTSQGSGSAPIWSTSSAGSAANEIVVKDSGSTVGSAGTVNFGSGLDVSALSNGQVTVTTTPGSGVPGISTIATSTFKDVVVTGVSTLGSSNGIGTVTVGVGTTALMVDGHARVTGPLTIGSGSITLDGSAEEIKIGNTFLKRDSSTGDLDVTDDEGNYKTIKMKGGNAVTQSDAIAFAIALG